MILSPAYIVAILVGGFCYLGALYHADYSGRSDLVRRGAARNLRAGKPPCRLGPAPQNPALGTDECETIGEKPRR